MSPETAAAIDQIQVTLNAGGMNATAGFPTISFIPSWALTAIRMMSSIVVIGKGFIYGRKDSPILYQTTAQLNRFFFHRPIPKECLLL